MSNPETVEQFIDLLLRSKLVDRESQEASFKIGVHRTQNVKMFAAGLVDKGLLTPWQARKLLQGKYKGFSLGNYLLLNHLGAPGVSNVYLAKHTLMKRSVAIKILPRNLAANETYLADFQVEAQATAAWDHPNIVRVFDVESEGNVHFLVMEYVPGRNMEEIVSAVGPLPIDVSVEIIAQAALGLHYAHEKSMIHREVMPTNLLLSESGQIKLLDLGLARPVKTPFSSLTLENQDNILGTIGYLSPEQVPDGTNVDRRADIYGLGCTWFYLLTGKQPYTPKSVAECIAMHHDAPVADPRKHCPEIPGALAKVCCQMMAKTPAQRFDTAGKLVDCLQPVRGEKSKIKLKLTRLATAGSPKESPQPQEKQDRLNDSSNQTPNIDEYSVTVIAGQEYHELQHPDESDSGATVAVELSTQEGSVENDLNALPQHLSEKNGIGEGENSGIPEMAAVAINIEETGRRKRPHRSHQRKHRKKTPIWFWLLLLGTILSIIVFGTQLAQQIL